MTSTFSQAINSPCQFGDWRFDPKDGQLQSKQKSVRLQPRHAKLLAIFTANVDVLIARNDLVTALWQEKSVNEDALSRSVAELRSILGDNRTSPIYIQTVPKKGYRFIHPVRQGSAIKKSYYFLSFVVSLAIIGLFIAFSAIQNETVNSNKLAETIRAKLLNAKRLITDANLEYHPQLSGIGNKLAFSELESQRLIVKVINPDGTSIHEIRDPSNNLYSATFSPDDNLLLIAALNNGKCTSYLYQLPSLQRNNIGDCMIPNLSGIYDWSIDGKQLAFVAPAKHTEAAAIWTYNFETKQTRQMTQPQGLSIFDTQPKFSPDGKQIAFTRGTKSNRHIYLVDISQQKNSLSKANKLTTQAGFITSLNWLKDGHHLLYDSDSLGDRNLWLINLASRKSILLGARDTRFSSINTDKSRFSFQEIRFNANIWSVFLEQSSIEQQFNPPNLLIQSNKYNNFPAFSPDGKQIAFSSNRQGKAAIWLYDLTTQKQTKLLSIADTDLFMPVWSNDAQSLLINSKGTKGYQCFQLDLKSHEYNYLTTKSLPHTNCIYSKQNNILALSKVPSGNSELTQLLKLNSDNQFQPLNINAVKRIMISEADQIIYTLENEDGLYSMDLNANNTLLLIKGFKSSQNGHWTVQGRYLYYSKLEGDQRGIWQYDLSTQQEVMVTDQIPSAIGFTLSVNPSHTQLVFSQTDSKVNVVYIADLKL